MKLVRTKKRTSLSVLAFASAFALVSALAIIPIARGQVPSANAPFNVDTGALITDTAAGPGTVSSAQQANLDKTGIICTYTPSAVPSGAPSVVFNIQNYDSASNTYYTMVAAPAYVPVSGTPTSIVLYPSTQITPLPTPIVAAVSMPLTRFWRVQRVSTGAGTTVTGKLGCNQIK